ncbi:MAG: BrnA antitoxin family protein [Candidatus Binataceae bacterium]
MRKLKRKLKSLPDFKSEAEERVFWETHDTIPYVDWDRATVAVFPNLRPSTTTISLRLPEPLLADLKALANKRDVPYQSLLKVFLAERVAAEWRGTRSKDRLKPAPVLRKDRRPARTG